MHFQDFFFDTDSQAGQFSVCFCFLGSYRYQFTQLGTFYVWSGYVDVYGIKNYAGQIEVVEKSSSLAQVSVKVDGIEAIYNVGG